MKDDGGSIFIAGVCDLDSGEYHIDDGMTLRDYFAAHCSITLTDCIKMLEQSGKVIMDLGEILEEYAILKGLYADAMLAEREKK